MTIASASASRFGVESVVVGDRRLLFHGGGFAGFSSLIARSLEDGVALIVLSNADGFDASAAAWLPQLWATAPGVGAG